MLRDKFAMAALIGACASRAGSTNLTYDDRAEFAYKQADAMMKERAKWDFSRDPDNPAEYPSGYSSEETRMRPINAGPHFHYCENGFCVHCGQSEETIDCEMWARVDEVRKSVPPDVPRPPPRKP